jgi:hypothetical protein
MGRAWVLRERECSSTAAALVPSKGMFHPYTVVAWERRSITVPGIKVQGQQMSSSARELAFLPKYSASDSRGSSGEDASILEFTRTPNTRVRRKDRRGNSKAAQGVPSSSGSRSTEAGPGCNVLNSPGFPRCTFRKLSCKGLFFQSTTVYSYEGE